MKRATVALVGVCVIFLVGLVGCLLGSRSPSLLVHTYTLAQVYRGLHQQPKSWAGHIVVVNGSIQTVQASSSGPSLLTRVNYLHPASGVNVRLLLVPPGGRVNLRTLSFMQSRVPSLSLSPQLPVSPANPLQRFLQQIPVINHWFQADTSQSWQTAHTFRIKLLSPPQQATLCGNTSCPDALLLQLW